LSDQSLCQPKTLKRKNLKYSKFRGSPRPRTQQKAESTTANIKIIPPALDCADPQKVEIKIKSRVKNRRVSKLDQIKTSGEHLHRRKSSPTEQQPWKPALKMLPVKNQANS